MSEIKVNKISPRTACGTVTVGDSGDSVSVTAGVPVTVNGDLKSNALKATDGGSIISQSGTTITIGASGDTVSLASGASQSGFGRSGSVDWQTGSIKTATFTPTSGEGYFCNTSGGAFTANLPAGSAGAIVAFSDYLRTFGSNNLTISPNGSEKIGGVPQDAKLSVNGQAATFIYVDATNGWINVQNAEDTETGVREYVCATGGTITNTPTCRIHTFTGPGTFTVNGISTTCTNRNKVAYMVVAGGGAGGFSNGGGGGAGGYREGRCNPVTPYTASPGATTGHTVTATSFPITVGAGGTYPGGGGCGGSGSPSIFSSFTSTGGGGGGNSSSTGKNGGSGGGGGNNTAGGNGNTPSVSPPQGKNGGSSSGAGPSYGASGGGGYSGVGGNGSGPSGGNGGSGTTSCITGSPVGRAGGAGGANDPPSPAPSPGGSGGGAGTNGNGVPGTGNPGTVNTGGGGGGGTTHGCGSGGGSGGSGIVVIRYKIA
jgi:hypothetical protein